MVIKPGAASTAHLPHALHATEQTAVAALPSSRLLHCTISLCCIGMSVNSPSGQASTHSLHAVQSSGSTTGSCCSFSEIAPNVQDTAQSPKPTQPQEQDLPPPETATAAAQLSMPM